MNIKRLLHTKFFGGLFWFVIHLAVLWLILLNIGKVGEPGALKSLIEITAITAVAIIFLLGVCLRCRRGIWPFEMSWEDLKNNPTKK